MLYLNSMFANQVILFDQIPLHLLFYLCIKLDGNFTCNLVT